ncbi:MAG: EF-hand domain-containing protein [Erythrobacter sp.]|nr:EF-hand domain-containing protein [Erythrobacter sp.]
MRNWLLGGLCALMLVGIGFVWWQGRAEVERGAPPPLPVEPTEVFEDPQLPSADAADLRGPEPPEATELTREQRRFFRYDRNRDWKISRTEMLSSRTDAFRKLDKDGNNLLDFEEWAVATVEKFEGADADGNLSPTPAEFATTAPKRRAKPACRC